MDYRIFPTFLPFLLSLSLLLYGVLLALSRFLVFLIHFFALLFVRLDGCKMFLYPSFFLALPLHFYL